MSLYSTDEGAEKIFRGLREDSESISRALAEYMWQREEVIRQQLLAKDEYDREMLQVAAALAASGISSYEETVDHNLMRHLHAVRHNEDETFADESFETQEDIPQLTDGSIAHSRANGKEKREYIKEKRVVPSFEEKRAIRDRMFAFLDESRLREMNLVCSMTGFLL